MLREICDFIGLVLVLLLAIGTVVANLIAGGVYDLDKPKHPAAELPKAKSTQTQARK